MVTNHGGPIDSYTENTLYDFIGEDTHLEPGEDSFEFYGIHLVPQSETRFIAQLDGHAGAVKQFDATEYGDVLELVDELMSVKILWNEYEYQDDREALVEWAGRIMTSDPNRDPDLFLHVPEELLGE